MSDEAKTIGEPLIEDLEPDAEEYVAEPFPVVPALVVAAAIVAAAALGAPVHLRAPAIVTLAPVAAVIAAIGLRKPHEAALVAGFASLAGLVLSSALAQIQLAFGTSGALGEAVIAAAVAAGLAFAARLALDRADRLRPLLVGAALVLVLASTWYAVVTSATEPAKDGSTFAGMLSSAPAPAPEVPVQGAYLGLIERLRAGKPYYASAVDALAKANAAYDDPDDLKAPLALPAPALYVTLSWLPAGGLALLLAALVAATLGTFGAYLLASRYMEPHLALAGAVAAGGYFTGVCLSVHVLDAEPWAGAFGVLALGLLAAALDSPRGAALQWAAAAAALVATLLREPAAVFLLAGLGALLADEQRRAERAWPPWAVASAAGLVAIVAHARAAASAVGGLTQAASAAPVPASLTYAFQGLASVMGVAVAVAWVVALLGLCGAVIAPRTSAARIAVAGALLAGAATYLVLPSGGAGVIAPSLLACVPLVLAAVPAEPLDVDA